MWYLDFDTDDLTNEQIIDARKFFGTFVKEARKNAKHEACLICGEKAPFCNSHTIPQFCLKHITYKGKVKSLNAFLGTELLSPESGINNAGTFHVICRHCDGTIFQDYENSQAYLQKPSYNVLNQIALKNVLRDIYKHETEIEMMKIMKKNILQERTLLALMFMMGIRLNEQIKARSKDIEKCYDIFNVIKNNINSDVMNYRLVSYDKLEYVVPIAFQGMIALITGVNGEVINNIYSTDSDYNIEYLHIAIFPLENTSVVITFTEDRNNRILSFEEALKGLTFLKRLEIINKIVFWYAEDYFFSPYLSEEVIKYLERSAGQMQDLFTDDEEKSLENAVKDYDLRRDIYLPNLLSKEYAVSS